MLYSLYQHFNTSALTSSVDTLKTSRIISTYIAGTHDHHSGEQTDDTLPANTLNAKGVLYLEMPTLILGKAKVQAVSNAGSIYKYFNGNLAFWDTFPKDALEFFEDPRIVDDMERCQHLPISPDPETEKFNKHFTTKENMTCGGEITLSGRFYQNALKQVTAVVQTLSDPEYGESDHGPWLPYDLTFGDSWIINRPQRVAGREPDVVLKLQIDGEQVLRLVGELKFCGTVDLEAMIHEALIDEGTNFVGNLGQIVDYMLSHRLKYGFISNYESTTILWLDYNTDKQGVKQACVYFSPSIKHSDDGNSGKVKVSLRMALFYLIHMTNSDEEQAWKIDETYRKSTKFWIVPRVPTKRELLPSRSQTGSAAPNRQAPFRTPLNTRAAPYNFSRNTAGTPPRSAFRNSILDGNNGSSSPPFEPDTPSGPPRQRS
ncbi:hypothetical protein HBI56_105380 [Parastagonospora nodorum]|nr:hypothetical protein HBH52_133150 [Parastagonospora nodorum]KAH3995840.1 hypothetical protein HBI10_164220 [Parastagonospora nodorum]KAH4021644.1 hypothetical protein HBI13_105450 [Parastagonospora nodorum]KAH4030393.1 hypothetical protein HBI09_128940 [Parastagonospora nodorum]KAH4048365.1 hypothetical protein HBH49_157700 [Parastagonospora nodorum]